jgi:hypothetical protein
MKTEQCLHGLSAVYLEGGREDDVLIRDTTRPPYLLSLLLLFR